MNKLLAITVSIIMAAALAAVAFSSLDQAAAADENGCLCANVEEQSGSDTVSRTVIYLGDYVVDGKVYFEGFFDLNGDGFGQNVSIDGAEVVDDEDLYLEITDCAFDPDACAAQDDAFYYQHGSSKDHISIEYRMEGAAESPIPDNTPL